MKKYFILSILMIFISTQLVFAQEAEEIKEKEESTEAQEEPLDKDFIPFLDHFAFSLGKRIELGILNLESETGDDLETETLVSFKGAIFLRLEENNNGRALRSEVIKIERTPDKTLKEGRWGFTLFSIDAICRSELIPTASHIKLGVRILNFKPEVETYDAQSRKLFGIHRLDILEFDLPVPVWKMGSEHEKIRLVCSPEVRVSAGNQATQVNQGQQARYPNLVLEDTDSSSTTTATGGVNVLLLIGERGRDAWQLGGSAKAIRESGRRNYRYNEDSYRIFLATPEYGEDDKLTYQIRASLSVSDTDIKTFVDFDNPNSQSRRNNGKLKLPSVDFDQEAFECNLILRF